MHERPPGWLSGGPSGGSLGGSSTGGFARVRGFQAARFLADARGSYRCHVFLI